MIILDTNVVSEAMRGPNASPRVIGWLSGQSGLVTTVITRAEIMAGIALLPEGRRRDMLRDAAASAFDMLGACLPLTSGAADHYAAIVCGRRAVGRPIGSMAALIAAIAREAGATLATRDTDDFDGLGITLVNPFARDR